MVLEEIAAETDLEEVLAATEATLTISDQLTTF
jgi:hypothetical protein